MRFEVIVPRQQSELFNTAVYRFLEARLTTTDDLVKLDTEPQGEVTKKAVTLWSEDAVADFLRDIATLSELQAMSERLEVAKQLKKGLSYREVSKNTGASTTTVTRVARFIENGQGGYKKYLEGK